VPFLADLVLALLDKDRRCQVVWASGSEEMNRVSWPAIPSRDTEVV
jgi:hypothetical protein